LKDFGQMLIFTGAYVTLYLVAVRRWPQLLLFVGSVILVISILVVGALPRDVQEKVPLLPTLARPITAALPARIQQRFHLWLDGFDPPSPEVSWWKKDYQDALNKDPRLKELAAREEINAAAPKDKDGKPAYKISVNDFVIKALALALQRVPDANVTWTEGAMLRHKHSDVGVAVSIPGGLITPVVRHAEQKSLSVISDEMKDFAARARARKLAPQEYQGGTSAVSNLGMYGIKDFYAIINPPHATILSVGAAEERAVARNGKIEAAHMMTVGLATDHRAVDGALGAVLLNAFKALIENPVMMVV